jgi:hypothetical protein
MADLLRMPAKGLKTGAFGNGVFFVIIPRIFENIQDNAIR